MKTLFAYICQLKNWQFVLESAVSKIYEYKHLEILADIVI